MRHCGTGLFPHHHHVPVSPLVACPSLLALAEDLSARGTLGDDVAQVLLQIRKLRPRTGKGFVLDPLPGQVSQNWALSLLPVFLLGPPAKAVGHHPSLLE